MKQHKYERIDKGVKRPKEPVEQLPMPTPGRKATAEPIYGQAPDSQLPATVEEPIKRFGARAGMLADLDDEMVFDRLAAGEHATSIADELGVHPSAISHRYSGNERYMDARRSGSECRLTAAELAISEAITPFTLARAREVFRAVAWRCEREFPDKWASKQEVKHTGPTGPMLTIVLSPQPDTCNTPAIDGQVIDSDDM